MPLRHIGTLAKVGCNSSLMFQQSQYKMPKRWVSPKAVVNIPGKIKFLCLPDIKLNNHGSQGAGSFSRS